MSVAKLIDRAGQAGLTVRLADGKLKLTGLRAAVERWMARSTSSFSRTMAKASCTSTVGRPRPRLAVYSFSAARSSLPMPM